MEGLSSFHSRAQRRDQGESTPGPVEARLHLCGDADTVGRPGVGERGLPATQGPCRAGQSRLLFLAAQSFLQNVLWEMRCRVRVLMEGGQRSSPLTSAALPRSRLPTPEFPRGHWRATVTAANSHFRGENTRGHRNVAIFIHATLINFFFWQKLVFHCTGPVLTNFFCQEPGRRHFDLMAIRSLLGRLAPAVAARKQTRTDRGVGCLPVGRCL